MIAQRIVERTLHLAIETCMDVADHLVADARLRVPETGAATFDILAEGGILSRALAPTGASLPDLEVHHGARAFPGHGD